MNKKAKRDTKCCKCHEKFEVAYYRQDPCLCKKCTRNKRLSNKVKELEEIAKPKITNQYCQYLFNLYLQHLHQYKIKPGQVQQTSDLIEVFSKNNFKRISSWERIIHESKKFKKKYGEKHSCGCPFSKIGNILTELGVISPKREECGHYYPRLFDQLSTNSVKIVKSFIERQKQSNLSPHTVIRRLEILVQFEKWPLSSNLLSVGTLDLQNYFNALKSKGYTHSYILQVYINLSTFYRWAKSEKKVFINPCDSIEIKNGPKQIVVCSESQCKKMFQFIKNPNSDPEQAMLLALILVWGLRGEDLSFAQTDFNEKRFKIILRRKKLTNAKYYNREQILELPISPQWFYQLQKKFIKRWHIQYGQLKNIFPKYYLMLPRYRSAWPLSKSTITHRVYEATLAAIGEKIPLRVLRKTCGHLHTIHNDSSLLSRLGWSHHYCFNYTWVPKVYFSSPKS